MIRRWLRRKWAETNRGRLKLADGCDRSRVVKDSGKWPAQRFGRVVNVCSVKSVATAWFGTVACVSPSSIDFLSPSSSPRRLRHHAAPSPSSSSSLSIRLRSTSRPALCVPFVGQSVGPNSDSSPTVDRQDYHRAPSGGGVAVAVCDG